MLNAFQIPYTVIHDEDPLPNPIPDTWNEDKEKAKRATFAMNATIAECVAAHLGDALVLSPDFEGACGVSRSQGEKKGKALAALEHFAGLSDDQLPGRLLEVCRRAYAVGYIPDALGFAVTGVPAAASELVSA